jgi:hypothetical protein
MFPKEGELSPRKSVMFPHHKGEVFSKEKLDVSKAQKRTSHLKKKA